MSIKMLYGELAMDSIEITNHLLSELKSECTVIAEACSKVEESSGRDSLKKQMEHLADKLQGFIAVVEMLEASGSIPNLSEGRKM